MLRQHFALVVLFFLLLGLSPPLSSQVRVRPPRPTCFEKAAQIRPNSRITVTKRDGSKIPGRLATVDLGQSLLTIKPVLDTNETVSSFHISEVAKIEHHQGGRLEKMGIGFLVGAGVGALIGYSSGGSENSIVWSSPSSVAAVDAVLFGFVGLLVGMILPTSSTFGCK